MPEGTSLLRIGAGGRRVVRWRQRALQDVNVLNGNTISGGGRVNTWDSQNRLVQGVSGGNTSQFVYGADGLRRTSIVNGNPVHRILDSGMMVRELRAEGQELRATATYLIGPRGPEYRLAKLRAEGQELRADQDSGNRTASARPRHGSVSGCDVYGLVRAGAGGTSRHKRRPELVEGFVGSLGHTSEDETGLIYMRARWMDPALGRFISEDPARDGANWFEYCRGNPVNMVDCNGRVPVLLVAFLVGFVGMALGDLAYQGWTKKGDIDWLEVFAAGIAGGIFGVGAAGLAVGTSSLAAGSSLAEAATAVACCFSAKQVSLAVAAWAVGLGVIGGGGSGLCAATIYIYGRQFQVSALLKSLEGETQ